MSFRMQWWNAPHFFIGCIYYLLESQRQQSGQLISVHQTARLHTDGLFFSLCSPSLVFALAEFITLCLYGAWITLHSQAERRKKEREEDRFEVGFLWPALPFPWMSLSGRHVQIRLRFTHCSRLSSGPRGISKTSGRWGSGPRGVFFSFPFFFPPWLVWLKWLLGEHGAAGGEACLNTTRYWLNNLCVIW